jgi:hypothetical protein
LRAWLATLGATVLSACTVPGTGVVVRVDSDARERIASLRVITSRGTRIAADAQATTFVRSMHAGDLRTWPVSFGVIPGTGPRDATVTVQVEATVDPARTGDPSLQIRRTVRFTFVPGTPSEVPVYLSISCTALIAPPARCARTPADACTVQAWCEEQVPEQTCGDQGQCIPVDVQPVPIADGGPLPSPSDGAAPHDVPAPDAADALDVVATDVSYADVTCTPNCGRRNCGDDGCGGSCGTCPRGQVCGGGLCYTPCTPNCAGRNCGDDGCGGSCGTCSSPQLCNTSGTCYCPAGYTRCVSGQVCCGASTICGCDSLCVSSASLC